MESERDHVHIGERDGVTWNAWREPGQSDAAFEALVATMREAFEAFGRKAVDRAS